MHTKRTVALALAAALAAPLLGGCSSEPEVDLEGALAGYKDHYSAHNHPSGIEYGNEGITVADFNVEKDLGENEHGAHEYVFAVKLEHEAYSMDGTVQMRRNSNGRWEVTEPEEGVCTYKAGPEKAEVGGIWTSVECDWDPQAQTCTMNQEVPFDTDTTLWAPTIARKGTFKALKDCGWAIQGESSATIPNYSRQALEGTWKAVSGGPVAGWGGADGKTVTVTGLDPTTGEFSMEYAYDIADNEAAPVDPYRASLKGQIDLPDLSDEDEYGHRRDLGSVPLEFEATGTDALGKPLTVTGRWKVDKTNGVEIRVGMPQIDYAFAQPDLVGGGSHERTMDLSFVGLLRKE